MPAFLETWKLAALEPARFFRQVRVSQAGSAVLFGTVAFTIGMWGSLVFRYLSANATAGFMAQLSRRAGSGLDTSPLLQFMQSMTLASFVGEAVATPLIAVLFIYLNAAMFHLLLLMVRGGGRGFDATLTVVGYAYGVLILQAVPACGSLIAAVWFVVVSITGLSEAQRSGTGKAAFAVLVPLVLLCAFFCIASAVAGLALGGFGGGLKGLTPPSTGL